ncbi:hypothetical protein OGATHE_004386 [Ogataea polymorpha]|uniref:Uncharacterized protein n=1 Tax=Ogataea polymorpha TaxID=460523 RepID=A0A9P8T2C7_9ASCO|nr:hypothetical protein OGATHE_004386 [Ogataea polymorpha]
MLKQLGHTCNLEQPAQLGSVSKVFGVLEKRVDQEERRKSVFDQEIVRNGPTELEFLIRADPAAHLATAFKQPDDSPKPRLSSLMYARWTLSLTGL